MSIINEHLVVTGLWRGGEILQCCDKVVTKLMTNMTLWSQSCSELVKLLHGCDKLATR